MPTTNSAKKAIEEVKEVINVTDTAINEGLVNPFVNILKQEQSKKKKRFKFLHRKKTNDKRFFESEVYERFLEKIGDYQEFLKNCKYFNQISIPKINFLVENFKKYKLKKHDNNFSLHNPQDLEFIENLTNEMKEINKEISVDLEKLCKDTVDLSDSFQALSLEFQEFQNKLSTKSAWIQACVAITALVAGTVILLAATVFVPVVALPLVLLIGIAGSTLAATIATISSTMKLDKRSRHASTLQKASSNTVDQLSNIKKSLVEVGNVLENNDDANFDIKRWKESEIEYFIQDNMSLIVVMSDFVACLDASIEHLEKSRAIISKAVAAIRS